MTLTDLSIGESSTIKQICDKNPSLAIELEELGFIPGTPVTLSSKTLFSGPMAFELRGSTIALRKNEAKAILL